MFDASLDPVSLAATAGLVVLSVALCCCFVRLWMGPSLPDRVVALDVFATVLVGLFALSAVLRGEMHLIRVATVLALVNFVGSVAFALYLRRKAAR